METLKLILLTLQEEAVYGWILGAAGATSSVIRQQNDNKDPTTPEEINSATTLVGILLGTVFSKFLSHPIAELSTFLMSILPLIYIITGRIGNTIVTGIGTFVKKLVNSLTSDDTMTAIMDYLKSFITPKQNKNNGLQ